MSEAEKREPRAIVMEGPMPQPTEDAVETVSGLREVLQENGITAGSLTDALRVGTPHPMPAESTTQDTNHQYLYQRVAAGMTQADVSDENLVNTGLTIVLAMCRDCNIGPATVRAALIDRGPSASRDMICQTLRLQAPLDAGVRQDFHRGADLLRRMGGTDAAIDWYQQHRDDLLAEQEAPCTVEERQERRRDEQYANLNERVQHARRNQAPLPSDEAILRITESQQLSRSGFNVLATAQADNRRRHQREHEQHAVEAMRILNDWLWQRLTVRNCWTSNAMLSPSENVFRRIETTLAPLFTRHGLRFRAHQTTTPVTRENFRYSLERSSTGTSYDIQDRPIVGRLFYQPLIFIVSTHDGRYEVANFGQYPFDASPENPCDPDGSPDVLQGRDGGSSSDGADRNPTRRARLPNLDL